MMGAVLPYSDGVSPSTTQVGEKPGVVRKIVSAKGGMDKGVLQKTCVAQDWFGNNYFTKDYWINHAQSSSTSPLDDDEPCFVFQVTPVIPGQTIAWALTTRITYHLQYFDLRTSEKLSKHQIEVDDADEDTESMFEDHDISEKTPSKVPLGKPGQLGKNKHQAEEKSLTTKFRK